MISTESSYLATLRKQHYAILGEHQHSAAKACLWTKKSLKGEGVCYKQAFYGIQSHRCLQMTPNIYCPQRCVFCWRSWENEPHDYLPGKWDEPEQIVDASIEAQQKLLSGLGGHEGVDKQKFKEAQNPNQVAISLTGEPTQYPQIGELVEEYDKRGFTTFIVTNGLFPERIESMERLPTQLYVSLDAPNKALQRKIDAPQVSDSWERLNKTLELLPSLGTRRVIRITAVKGLSMLNPEQYAELIKKSEADFVEVKAYMLVGYSRERLRIENMPRHHEVVEFAKELNEHLGYDFAGEKEESRVALLSSGQKKQKITSK
jgi:tRNA wybutosine-synthesizing protein 1